MSLLGWSLGKSKCQDVLGVVRACLHQSLQEFLKGASSVPVCKAKVMDDYQCCCACMRGEGLVHQLWCGNVLNFVPWLPLPSFLSSSSSGFLFMSSRLSFFSSPPECLKNWLQLNFSGRWKHLKGDQSSSCARRGCSALLLCHQQCVDHSISGCCLCGELLLGLLMFWMRFYGLFFWGGGGERLLIFFLPPISGFLLPRKQYVQDGWVCPWWIQRQHFQSTLLCLCSWVSWLGICAAVGVFHNVLHHCCCRIIELKAWSCGSSAILMNLWITVKR